MSTALSQNPTVLTVGVRQKHMALYEALFATIAAVAGVSRRDLRILSAFIDKLVFAVAAVALVWDVGCIHSFADAASAGGADMATTIAFAILLFGGIAYGLRASLIAGYAIVATATGKYRR